MKTFAITVKCHRQQLSLTSPCGLSEPFNPSTAAHPYPVPRQYHAIWDTGASYCAITQKVVDELGLTVRRPIHTETAKGGFDTYAYLVNVILPNNLIIPGRWATLSIINGADMLIGMDVISLGDFAVSSKGNEVKFTFQIPSTHDTDYTI